MRQHSKRRLGSLSQREVDIVNCNLSPEDAALVAYAKEHYGAVLSCVVDLNTGEVHRANGTDVRSTASRVGLSNVHILPHEGKLTLWEGGGLVKVTKPGRWGSGHEPGKRGAVSAMSRASRRRLMYRLGMIRRSITPDFVTLTYPGKYEGSVKTCKRDLEALRKRLERIGAAAVWRLEFKQRKTGASEGEVVPHFHMLLWRPNHMSLAELQAWISRAWWEIVGSGSLDHLVAGTSCERMRSWRGVMYYAAKYISKEDSELLPEGAGRQWGVINEGLIPWAEMKQEAITDRQCFTAIKLLESIVGYEMRQECPSMTALVDSPEHWRDVILKL